MTTLVVVKKAGQVAIAADTLVTFGDTSLGHRYEANSKIFKVDTPAGMSGKLWSFVLICAISLAA